MKEVSFLKSIVNDNLGEKNQLRLELCELTTYLIFLMYYEFSRRHLTSYTGYNFMPSLNFRFMPRFVPLKVHCGHGHLLLHFLQSHHLPHTIATLSYQAEPLCLLHIYHRVSVSLLDTIQTLLTYLYYETESSEIFSNTHMRLVFSWPQFILGYKGSAFPWPIKTIILGPTHTYFYLEDKSSTLFNRNKHFNPASNLHYATFFDSVLAACL